MVELTVADGMLEVEIIGWHKIFTARSRFLIPLGHVSGMQRYPEGAKGWWKGCRFLGTGIPGVLAAGWYYKDGRHQFWDVHKPQNAISIDLIDEGYKRLGNRGFRLRGGRQSDSRRNRQFPALRGQPL